MRSVRVALALLVLVARASLAEDPPTQKKILRAAAVQMRSTRDLGENLKAIQEHLREADDDGVRVVVFPECALTGYFDDAHCRGTVASDLEQAFDAIAATCRELGVYAIVGTALPEGDRVYNSGVVFDPRGEILERYHKMQLAERWPDAGDHLSVFHIDGVPCSMIVCHDSRYPELVRLPVLAGAQVVFYLSHESGLKSEHKVAPYRAQVQARAVENSVYVVQANAPANDDLTGSHGQSRIVDPDGNLVEEASQFQDETVTADLDISRATRKLALLSIERGTLRDWWREGMSQVRVIPPPTVDPEP